MTSVLPLENEPVKNIIAWISQAIMLFFIPDFCGPSEKGQKQRFWWYLSGDLCTRIFWHSTYKSLSKTKRYKTKRKAGFMVGNYLFYHWTVCHPRHDKAALLSREVDSLKNEKISDGRSIISLQGQLIEKHEDSVKSVQSTIQTTVETEMKTYASAVTRSCSSALAPKEIEAAVKKVADKE